MKNLAIMVTASHTETDTRPVERLVAQLVAGLERGGFSAVKAKVRLDFGKDLPSPEPEEPGPQEEAEEPAPEKKAPAAKKPAPKKRRPGKAK